MPALTWNPLPPRHDIPHAPYDSHMFAPHHTDSHFPQQILHKLWILDCRSCGAFLTNRGMKAVLLLRPNVSLFSTDALPINCSAYSSNPDALRPQPYPPASYPRTCECLTQTMCCHRCGAAVGYTIVLPCSRCTSSITTTHRATNGHRFVFHSSELIATERHYIQDEPGVIPYDIPVPLQLFYHSPQIQSPVLPSTHPFLLVPAPHSDAASPGADNLPTPSLELAGVTPFTAPIGHSTTHRLSPRGPPHHLIVPSQSPMSMEHKDSAPLRRLKPGDVLFWHHLIRNGEIPGVEEDIRAREFFAAPSASFDR